MDKKSVIILIIACLVLFAVGAGLGFFYKAQADKTLTAGAKTAKILNSKLAYNLVLYGKVEKIEGRKITLYSEGDNAVLDVGDSAKIYSMLVRDLADPTDRPANMQWEVAFDKIKVNDYLNIVINISSAGTIEPQVITILSVLTPSNEKKF